MSVTPDYTEELLQVAGTRIQMLKGGAGEPLLLLHGAGGNPGWLAYQQALSQQFTVYAPSHPGYDRSSRPDWISSMNDMSHFYRQFIEELGMTAVRLMGFSMGGWLAAEIVAMCPSYVKSLILVDAAGIKPEVGEIAEILLVSQDVSKKLRFYDPTQVPDYDTVVNRQLTPPSIVANSTSWRCPGRGCTLLTAVGTPRRWRGPRTSCRWSRRSSLSRTEAEKCWISAGERAHPTKAPWERRSL